MAAAEPDQMGLGRLGLWDCSAAGWRLVRDMGAIAGLLGIRTRDSRGLDGCWFECRTTGFFH